MRWLSIFQGLGKGQTTIDQCSTTFWDPPDRKDCKSDRRSRRLLWLMLLMIRRGRQENSLYLLSPCQEYFDILFLWLALCVILARFSINWTALLVLVCLTIHSQVRKRARWGRKILVVPEMYTKVSWGGGHFPKWFLSSKAPNTSFLIEKLQPI